MKHTAVFSDTNGTIQDSGLTWGFVTVPTTSPTVGTLVTWLDSVGTKLGTGPQYGTGPNQILQLSNTSRGMYGLVPWANIVQPMAIQDANHFLNGTGGTSLPTLTPPPGYPSPNLKIIAAGGDWCSQHTGLPTYDFIQLGTNILVSLDWAIVTDQIAQGCQLRGRYGFTNGFQYETAHPDTGLSNPNVSTGHWFHIWLLTDGNGGIAFIYNLSSNTPPALTSIFPLYCYLGAVNMVQSFDFAVWSVSSIQRGKHVQYIADSSNALGVTSGQLLPQLCTGVQTTWTAFDISGWIPPNARSIIVSIGNESATSATIAVATNANFAATASPFTYTGASGAQEFRIVPETMTLYVSSTGASNFVTILGWEMP